MEVLLRECTQEDALNIFVEKNSAVTIANIPVSLFVETILVTSGSNLSVKTLFSTLTLFFVRSTIRP